MVISFFQQFTPSQVLHLDQRIVVHVDLEGLGLVALLRRRAEQAQHLVVKPDRRQSSRPIRFREELPRIGVEKVLVSE
jgi:hypothetical protein